MYHIHSMAHVKSYLISHHVYYMYICFSLDVRFSFCDMKPVRWVCYVCVWLMMAYGWSLISSENKLCQRSVCMWCDLTCLQKTHILGQSTPLMTVESCILSLWSATCLVGRGRVISQTLHLWEGSISPTYWRRVWTLVSCDLVCLKGSPKC